MPNSRVLASLAGAVALLAVVAHSGRQTPAVADAGVATQVNGAASGGRVATRIAQPAEVVSVSAYTVLSPAIIDRVEQMGLALDRPVAEARGLSARLAAVWRGTTPVQVAAGGSGVWQFPMSTTALPVEAAGAIMGYDVSATLAQGLVVMSTTSAGLRGAQVGDAIDLLAADNSVQRFTIGLVAPDAKVGGTEIVMSPDSADRIGATLVTRVLLYGQFSRDTVLAALPRYGLVDSQGVRVSRSWDPASPDSTIGLAATKVALGEFSFHINNSDSLTLDPAWVAANVQFRAYSGVGVRAYCHGRIVSDIQAALSEVADAGLAGLIDLNNTNTQGGCWNPRYVRSAANIGSVSRHAWAQALDMNTDANPQGGVPKMDCRIVRIFRKHNFAWGGNFTLSDGMHFEWVGEPRNTVQYPSKYCPNLPDGGISAAGHTQTQTVRATMFADDGFGDG